MQGLFTNSSQIYQQLPLHICSFGRFNNAIDLVRQTTNTLNTTAVWSANNRAVYVPLNLPAAFRVARFYVINGTNLTGTVDMGLYDDGGTLRVSTGATARAGASAVQYIGVTDIAFPAGHYYIALLATSTTGTYGMSVGLNAPTFEAAGLLMEEVGAAALPSTMTPVAYTPTNMPLFGVTQSDTF